MSDPIEDSLRANLQNSPKPASTQNSSGDPVEDSLRANYNVASQVQPVQDARKTSLFDAPDVIGGGLETIANAALGTAGMLSGGLAEVGGLLTGSTDRAQRWNEWTKRNVSTLAGLYDSTPETQTGKDIQDVGSAAISKLQQGAAWLGAKTLGATGSPLLATAVDVGTQAAGQALAGAVGARGVKALGRGISGSAEALRSPMDQGGGNQPLPIPAQGMERQIRGADAATASGNPYPELTGQQSVRGGNFPQVKLSQGSGDVPVAEQAVRSGILGQIMGEEGDRLRPGAVKGNEDTLRTEATLAKAANPTPQGLLLRDKFAQEQRALESYAGNIVDKTGAAPTLINDGMRGDLMNSTLYGPDSLRAFLATQKRQIYDEAADRQGPNPVTLPSLDKALGSPQLASTLKIAGQPNFLPGVQELYQQFKTNGFENPVTGEAIAPNTVGAAMELHKALNSAWTPDNSMYIGRLKKSILDDVAQAGGADLYQRGNAIHAAEQNLFSAPGIKKIFGEVNPNTGISEVLSGEKIPKKLNNLPVDQYAHIHGLFRDMANGRVPGAPDLQLPPELQMAGTQSANEMVGSLVRDVHQSGAGNAGVWNSNSANKTLNAHAQKLNMVADPDVLHDLHTLNLGGQLMPGMHAYEGAPMQARRMNEAGLLERNLPSLAGAAAAFLHPSATVAGMKGGEWLQGKAALRRQMQTAKETDAEMEAAAKIGKPLKDLMK